MSVVWADSGFNLVSRRLDCVRQYPTTLALAWSPPIDSPMCFYLTYLLIGNNFTHDGRERNHSGENSHLTNLPFSQYFSKSFIFLYHSQLSSPELEIQQNRCVQWIQPVCSNTHIPTPTHTHHTYTPHARTDNLPLVWYIST